MAKSSTSWKPGQSGNPAGRPKQGFELGELLLKSLDRKKSGKTKKQLLVDTLIDLSLKKDIKAIKMIWDILMNDYQFHKKLDIEERIEEIERRLDDE